MPVMPASGYFNIFSQTFTEKATELSASHILNYVPQANVPQNAIYNLIKDIGNKAALNSILLAHIVSQKHTFPGLTPQEVQECLNMIRDYSSSSVKLRANVEPFKLPYDDVEPMRLILDCVRKAFAIRAQSALKGS